MTMEDKKSFVDFVKNLRNVSDISLKDKRIILLLPTKSERLAKEYDLKELSK